MKPVCEFLGWNKPILHLTLEFLEQRYLTPTLFDLSNVILSFPGGRAGRRMLEMLILRAEELDRSLVPPIIITTGKIPDLFLTSPSPLINDLSRSLIFAEAISTLDQTDIKYLFPDTERLKDPIFAYQLGAYIDGIYKELSGENLTFKDVIAKVKEPQEEVRWGVIQNIYDFYEHKLKSLALNDRRMLCEQALLNNSLFLEKELYLIGATDLNGLTKKFIDHCSGKIIALIGAPADKCNLFDEYGSVNIKEWVSEDINIDPTKIILCTRSAIEGEAICEVLAKFKNVTPQSLTIGIGDQSLIPYIEESLTTKGIAIKSAVGRTVTSSPVLRALIAADDFMSNRTFKSLAGFIREPVVTKYLLSILLERGIKLTPSELFNVFDIYHSQYLQEELKDEIFGDSSEAKIVQYVYTVVIHLLKPLLVTDSELDNPVNNFALDISGVILALFGDREFQIYDREDSNVIESCEVLNQHVLLLEQALAITTQSITKTHLLKILIDSLSTTTLTPEQNPKAVEFLGWLELSLDDAPYVIVSGLNEGKIPESINEDPLLPNSLREDLGLLHNNRRYARDAYTLTSLIHSREDLYCILSGEDLSGSPMMPSRLLLACAANELPHRVLTLMGDGKGLNTTIQTLNSDKSEKSPSFKCDEILKIPVSGFKDYIECPFRFYLKHVVKVGEQSDHDFELNGRYFGIIAHDILADFAEGELSDSTDYNMIVTYLQDLLESRFIKLFGTQAHPAVYVQKELLRHRLLHFAKIQSNWASLGWKIAESEIAINSLALEITDKHGTLKNIAVSGRIDRIDYNSNSDEWAIIDYKTSNSADIPDKTHRTKHRGWIDLQLPLYYHAIKARGVKGKVIVGYCNLPDNGGGSEFNFANWSEQDFAEALQKANTVATNIYNHNFWPPAKSSTLKGDRYQPIVDQLLYEGG